METTKHINIDGWGIDADLMNEPTYPIKKYTGEDHERSHWERPARQPATVEILKSIERPYLSAVFGTVAPPAGLSGMIRRKAFRRSESMFRHWLPLLLADRINVVEGILHDLVHGHIPRLAKERGWGALWKFKPWLLVRKIVVRLLIFAALVWLLVELWNRKEA
ncbi:MAG: hypothetical protein ACJ76F_07655 [Bacteroidia bacterium]